MVWVVLLCQSEALIYFVALLYTAETFKNYFIIDNVMNHLSNIIEIFTPWLGLFISITVAITTVAAGVRWLTRHYFDEIKNQFKPNGGSSLRDQVNRLESEHKKLYNKIEDLEERSFESHNELSGKIDELYLKLIDLLSNKK